MGQGSLRLPQPSMPLSHALVAQPRTAQVHAPTAAQSRPPGSQVLLSRTSTCRSPSQSSGLQRGHAPSILALRGKG